MNSRQFGSGSGGSNAWIFQRISGAVILIAFILHYLYLHYFNGGAVTYEEVQSRLSTPLWKTIDIAFLTAALYHAVTGVIMNIHDYVHRAGLRITLIGLSWTFGLVLWLTGLVTVINF